MRRIVVTNQKGGTGKTTTAGNVAVGLSPEGRRVLLVDLDPQGSLAVRFGAGFGANLYHLLTGEAALEECTCRIADRLDLVPCNKTLAHAEMKMAAYPHRERRLDEALADARHRYDYVIVDSAPSLNLLNLNALRFAHEAFIPVTMDYLSLVGAREVLDNLRLMRERMGHDLKVGMIIPTFFDRRDRKSRDVLATLTRHFNGLVVDPVRKNVKLAEAIGRHRNVFDYAPRSHGAEDYRRIVDRIIATEQN